MKRNAMVKQSWLPCPSSSIRPTAIACLLASALLLQQCVQLVTAGCELRAFDGDSEIKGLCVKEFKRKECEKYMTTLQPSDLPRGFPKGTSMADKPQDVIVTGILTLIKKRSFSFYMPGFSIRWKPPATGATADGYLFRWDFAEMARNNCMILQLSKSNPHRNNKNLTFRYDIKGVMPGRHYSVKIYSIPTKLGSFREVNFTAGSAITDGMDSSEWRTFVSLKVFAVGMAEVRFTYAQSRFHFIKYKVQLVWLERDMWQAYATVTHTGKQYSLADPGGIVRFSNLSVGVGTYKALVRPLDPYRWDRNKCLCWVIKREEKNCDTCAISTSHWTHIGDEGLMSSKRSNQESGDGKNRKCDCAELELAVWLLACTLISTIAFSFGLYFCRIILPE